MSVEMMTFRPGPAPLLDPRRQAEFCEHLSLNGNVRLACQAGGISPQTAYRARRASRDFARLWDAALVLARHAAEEVLDDRALNGVEEQVFYHGEEVATRRRYDSRLLLAHLARLDRKAEQGGAGIAESDFDEALASLERSESLPQPPPEAAPAPVPVLAQVSAPGPQPVGHHDPHPRDMAEQQADRADPANWDRGKYVPPFERRLRAMEAERPDDAPPLDQLGQWDEVESLQLAAFEAGDPEWWLATPEEEPEQE